MKVWLWLYFQALPDQWPTLPTHPTHQPTQGTSDPSHAFQRSLPNSQGIPATGGPPSKSATQAISETIRAPQNSSQNSDCTGEKQLWHPTLPFTHQGATARQRFGGILTACQG